jgi:S-adenosylmethionine:tRNA ribosyltransferase-isomerase
VGTTVVRALEHCCGRTGEGVADQRIGPETQLRVVDAILSGTHRPDESHHQVLRAFQDDYTLARAGAALEASSYRTHEFGDSVLIFSQRDSPRQDILISSTDRAGREYLKDSRFEVYSSIAG